MDHTIPNDFIVDWKGTEEETLKEILTRLLLNDIKQGMPAIVVITGRSGSGKSYTAIKLQQWFYEEKGIKYQDYLKRNIVLSPLDYGRQIKAILNEPELKPIFTIQIDEGRFVVGAENWGTFVNTAISHVNASSRSVKVMLTIIVTQSLRDIDKKLRDCINMQIICRKESDGYVVVSFRIFWIDDSDVEKPKLKYRIPQGTIRFPNGTKQKIKLKWKPRVLSKELSEPYEEMMVPIKNTIIGQKMDKLIQRLEKEIGNSQIGKAELIAEQLYNFPELRKKLGKLDNGSWRPNDAAKILFSLDEPDMKTMRKILTKKLKEAVVDGVATAESISKI